MHGRSPGVKAANSDRLGRPGADRSDAAKPNQFRFITMARNRLWVADAAPMRRSEQSTMPTCEPNPIPRSSSQNGGPGWLGAGADLCPGCQLSLGTQSTGHNTSANRCGACDTAEIAVVSLVFTPNPWCVATTTMLTTGQVPNSSRVARRTMRSPKRFSRKASCERLNERLDMLDDVEDLVVRRARQWLRAVDEVS